MDPMFNSTSAVPPPRTAPPAPAPNYDALRAINDYQAVLVTPPQLTRVTSAPQPPSRPVLEPPRTALAAEFNLLDDSVRQLTAREKAELEEKIRQAKLREAQERERRDREERERVARERAEAERRAREEEDRRRREEQIDRERAERDRRERQAREAYETEQARLRAERERYEKERVDAERRELDRYAREKGERDRKAELERRERERLELEKAETARLEVERAEREQRERELRMEETRMREERERLERERVKLERDRLERERERERLSRESAQREKELRLLERHRQLEQEQEQRMRELEKRRSQRKVMSDQPSVASSDASGSTSSGTHSRRTHETLKRTPTLPARPQAEPIPPADETFSIQRAQSVAVGKNASPVETKAEDAVRADRLRRDQEERAREEAELRARIAREQGRAVPPTSKPDVGQPESTQLSSDKLTSSSEAIDRSTPRVSRTHATSRESLQSDGGGAAAMALPPLIKTPFRHVEDASRPGPKLPVPRAAPPPMAERPAPKVAAGVPPAPSPAVQPLSPERSATPLVPASAAVRETAATTPAHAGITVKALFGYQANNSEELSFNTGDVLSVLDKSEEGWWMAELNGHQGWIPATYVEDMGTCCFLLMSSGVASKANLEIPLCTVTAIYDYECTRDDDLPLQAGEIVSVLDKSDADWWKGRLADGRTGFFPSNYVEQASGSDRHATSDVEEGGQSSLRMIRFRCS